MNINESIELVTLVDKNGNVRGYAEKIDAHLRGDLHLAFSLMLTRQTGGDVEYLLQRRALNKYHSGGLWANTCCSHPRPNETVEEAAQRRVYEELGVNKRLNLKTIGQICYEHSLDNNMIEHEYDHIVISQVDDLNWQANTNEAMDVKWWKEKDVIRALNEEQSIFAAWFAEVFEVVRLQALANMQQDGSAYSMR